MLFIMNGRFTINTQYNSIDEHISRNKTSHQIYCRFEHLYWKLLLSWTTTNPTFKRTKILRKKLKDWKVLVIRTSTHCLLNTYKILCNSIKKLGWRKTGLIDRRIKIKIPPPPKHVEWGIKYENVPSIKIFVHIHYNWLTRLLMFVPLLVSALICRKDKIALNLVMLMTAETMLLLYNGQVDQYLSKVWRLTTDMYIKIPTNLKAKWIKLPNL